VIPHGDVSMIRYLTWRNIFGVLLLAILVMIWPLEWIGWYSVTLLEDTSASFLKVNAITGRSYLIFPPEKKGGPVRWREIGQ